MQSPTQSQVTLNAERPPKNDEAEAQHHLELEGPEEDDDDEQQDKHLSMSSSSSISSCSQSPTKFPIQSTHFSKSPSPPPHESPLHDSPWHSTFTWLQNRSPNTPSPLALPNRSFPAEPLTRIQDPQTQDGFVSHAEESPEEASGSGGGGVGRFNRRKMIPDLTSRKWTTTSKKESGAMRVLLGFRICVFCLCLVSFSLMAADKEQGWALDSFYRYKEFRYCLAVNVLGCAYSGLQVYGLDISALLDKSKKLILSYLLMSASSSAATRVDDWQSNWGKDKFPDMARASVGLSFAAFVALACSSIISGFILFTPKSL
ncbi:hypothetical protein FEM48_Zijuj04G0029400 [Ziziphus jujuba var. spinosa]|uniref:CASP-like protein n=1 Tax=Ziziphus jujuba var. spinosa TaxID=714518 RepID=A0A978VHF6_ZIZJJ|nr:hypothetical protein FEM48_Zijuj04G0029400 [Ziziphus jujuba var. spinosa]